MARLLIRICLLFSVALLAGCGYDQVACTNCGYAPATTYVATTGYVATTSYVPATYINRGCCVTNCCPNCNRCSAAYYGYGGYGAGYGVEYNTTTWY